jgi:hypothetical protein
MGTIKNKIKRKDFKNLQQSVHVDRVLCRCPDAPSANNIFNKNPLTRNPPVQKPKI